MTPPSRSSHARPPARRSALLTFAFTDIEGSTRLLGDLRDGYADVLAEHADLVREVAGRSHGTEVDTQGDSFFLVFDRAAEAVEFAAELQRRLAEHHWPGDVAVRVRVGLHTGEARIGRTGYVGIDVHRAARIADAAHGGQIVLSDATRAALLGDADGLALRDLGPHRLKDLPEPERIYQLEIAGLAAEFPPLRSLDAPDEPPAPGEPPFQGLEAFDVADADRYFGREALTAELLEHLRERDFLAVIGASGSGKSSLARAGLVASLLRDPGRLDAGPWTARIITPTDRPLAALDAILDEAENDARPTVLLIDQLEELFTLCDDEASRTAFVERLLGWLTAHPGRAKVVLTLRADFYDRLADHPALRDAVAADQRYIGPMTRDELRRAIEEPARLGGWIFVPGLVELFLHDVGEEPGALPLLSHALLETWNRRRGRTMTLKGYGEAGGVTGAIARTADRVVLDELGAAEQAVARGVFLRLAEPGEEGRDTRRRAHLAELVPVGTERADVDRVVSALVAARLVTLGDDWAEVAHEALIAEWPALREWLDEDREGRRLHRRLTEAAHEWTVLDRDVSLLARGARLAQITDWASGHRSEMNADEIAYLEASGALERAEAEERDAQRERELEAARALAETEQRAASRLRRRAAILAVALVVAVGALGAAVWQATEAQRQADVAREQEAAAEAAQAEAEQQKTAAEQSAEEARSNALTAAAINALGTDPALAKLLALWAAGDTSEPTSEMVGVLHATLTADRVARRQAWPDLAFASDMSGSGDMFLAVGLGGLEVHDVETGDLRWSVTPAYGTSYGPAQFTSDGRFVVAGTTYGRPGLDGLGDRERKTAVPRTVGVYVWDAASGELVRHLAAPNRCGVATWAAGSDRALAFTFAEASGCIRGAFQGAPYGLVTIDLDSGDIKGLSPEVGGLESAERGALSPDGRFAAFDDFSEGGPHSKVLDLETGEVLLDLPTTEPFGSQEASWVRDISDDGRYLLLGDRPVQMVSVATGEVVARFAGESGFSNHAEFSPMSAGIAAKIPYPVVTNGRDGRVRLWDGRWGRELLAVPAIGSGLISVATDGRAIVQPFDADALSGGITDVAIVDLGVRGELGAVDALASDEYWPGPLFGTCLATAGSLRVAAGTLVYDVGCNGQQAEGTTHIVDVDDMAIRRSLPGANSQTVALSPDGMRLIRGIGDGFTIGGLEILDTRTGDRIVELEGACAWDARLGSGTDQEGCAEYPDQPFAIWANRMRWSPDGSIVAAVDHDGGFHAAWDARTGLLLTDEGSAEFTWDVAFTPDASRLIVAGYDQLESRSTETWQAETWAPLALQDSLDLVGFTDGGSTLVAISGVNSLQAGSASIRWFDVATLQENRSAREDIHDGSVKVATMSPSGALLATGASDGTVRVWDAAAGDLVHEIRTGEAEAQGLAFLDEERLAVVVRDGSLRVYTLDPDQLTDLVRGSLTRTYTPVECERFGIDPCPTLEELKAG